MSYHSTAHPATPFKLGLVATAAKHRAWCEVETEKAEADTDEDASPAVFLASGSVSTVFTVAPVQTTRHRYARNRRTSQQKTFAKSASK